MMSGPFAFVDGRKREIALEPYLQGPIVEAIRNNPQVLRSVRVEGNSIGCENGADTDPDVLYYGLQPAWKEEREAVCR
jgi:hypothetical protein